MVDVYKIRVSKTGYAYTNSDIAHIAFDSNINCFKIKTTSVVSLTVDDMALDITHGLDYAPAFLAWFEVDENGKWFPIQTHEDQSGHGVLLDCASDDTSLSITWSWYGGTGDPTTLRIFYMLIVDPVE